MRPAGEPLAFACAARAVLFDLDGVVTDTSELHYQSWQQVADELGVPFDRHANERLRGLSREQSLRALLGSAIERYNPARQADILSRKNKIYLERVQRLSPADAFEGIPELMGDLRRAGVRLAIASSSRNARTVLDRLGVAHLLDAVVDGNDAPRSKPDPQVFLSAAARLETPPARCLVVEDAASGVQAARAAGMRVVGVGPRQRVGAADYCVERPGDLRAADLLDWLADPR